jgi:hypothetical protein
MSDHSSASASSCSRSWRRRRYAWSACRSSSSPRPAWITPPLPPATRSSAGIGWPGRRSSSRRYPKPRSARTGRATSAGPISQSLSAAGCSRTRLSVSQEALPDGDIHVTSRLRHQLAPRHS